MANNNSKTGLSVGLKGMNRDTHNHLLDNQSFTYQRNGRMETMDGAIGLTNEPSNILCSNVFRDYAVIGHKYDNRDNKIYLFLSHKQDIDGEGRRRSMIGWIAVTEQFVDEKDIDLDCGCNAISLLDDTPLEDVENHVAHCEFNVLLEDCDENYCLNFDPNYPIHDVVLKQESCGRTMTWVSKNNPPRYIQLDNLDFYKYKGFVECGVDNRYDIGCLDCEKMRLFPQVKVPTLKAKAINYGGSLRRGVYEFYVAYCDRMGNELSDYFSATNPVSIFDTQNNILDQSDRFGPTTQSISVKVDNLDTRYNFYKVAVVERADINNATTVFIEGVHNIKDDSFTYYRNGDKENRETRITLERLTYTRPTYKTFGGLKEANGMLFAYDYEVEKEWNLQPVVNLLGTFVKWQTLMGSESAYADGVNTSLYRGYMRDEVYPLGIRFVTDYGYKTAVFPLISRPLIKGHDDELVNNDDTKSLNDTECKDFERNRRWQLYNTAKVLGPNVNFQGRSFERDKMQKSFVSYYLDDAFRVIDNGELVIDVDSTYVDLSGWILDHQDEIKDPNSKYYNETLAGYLDTSAANITDEELIRYFDITQGEEVGNCEIPVYKENTKRLFLKEVEGDKVINEYYRLPNEQGTSPVYEHTKTEECDIYSDNTDVIKLQNFDSSGYFDIETSEIKGRQNANRNETCGSAATEINEPVTFDIDYVAEVSAEITYTDETDVRRMECDLEKATSYLIFRGKGKGQGYEEVKPWEYTVNNGCKANHRQPSVSDKFAMNKSDLLTSIPAGSVEGFEDFVHTKALWFKYEVNEGFIFEVTPVKGGFEKDKVSSLDNTVRVNIYDGCRGKLLFTDTYNPQDGYFKRIDKNEIGVSEIYVSLDTKLLSYSVEESLIQGVGNDKYRGQTRIQRSMIATSGVSGCFLVKRREFEIYRTKIIFDKMTFGLKAEFEQNCWVYKSLDSDCGFTGHETGYFAYWESTEEYPDNKELYDSSKVKIDSAFIDMLNEEDELKEIFKNGYLRNNASLDFTCSNIRHFKFPDNVVSPFMTGGEKNLGSIDFSESIVYPLGVTINESTVKSFLDLAVESCLITKEQRDTIKGYELFRGDRLGNESIVMKGILHDMYKDDKNSTDDISVYFRNFPYNTLGSNPFVSDDKGWIKHPFNSKLNNRFSFVSPDIYEFGKNTLPSEMSVDGYMYGKSTSNTPYTKDYAKWVVLGNQAYLTAGLLGWGEALLEALLTTTELLISLENLKKETTMVTETKATSNSGTVDSKTTVTVGPGKSTWSKIALYAGYITNIGELITKKRDSYTMQWLDIYDNKGVPRDYAKLFLSDRGWYNSFIPKKPHDKTSNKLRRVVAKHLGNGVMTTYQDFDGNKSVGKGVVVNNVDREDSAFIHTNIPIEYPPEYVTYDNYDHNRQTSSRFLTFDRNFDERVETRNIASPYVSLQRFVQDQYGTIDSVRWLSTNHDSLFDNLEFGTTGKSVFGGDIYISRVDFKNKVALFEPTALGLANRTPFKHSIYNNIGKATYYLDAKTDTHTMFGGSVIAKDNFNLDGRISRSEFYVTGHFYTHVFGVPYFLVESTINANYRYAGKELHEQFAGRGVNVEEWLQPTNVNIGQENRFKYNRVYSENQTGLPSRILPSYYSKKDFDCKYDSENSVAWSDADYSEISFTEPWLSWRPYNIYRFPFRNGKLYSLENIESMQLLGRFEDNAVVFNAVDSLRDRITSVNEMYGTGGVFATRPVEFSHTDLGELGTINKAFVSNAYGHFWVDAKRGRVVHLQSGGKGVSFISDRNSQGYSGMGKWFRNHLPFKILKHNIEGLTSDDVDNAYKGLGIVMWWDNRLDRLFITKKDYIPLDKDIVFDSGEFYVDYTKKDAEKYPPYEVDCDECEHCDACKDNPCVDGKKMVNQRIKVELTDTRYFKDVSFTVSYSLTYQSWISYHDFKPNYAISLLHHFKTGVNYSSDEKEIGLWSHLLTQKSYQVYYGNKYPWEIRLHIQNEYANKLLKSLSVWAYSQRYHDNYNYALWRKHAFNKMNISNQTNNSGLLHLDYVDGYSKVDYPKWVSSTEQIIPVTHHNENININYFYNRVVNEDNHLPLFLNDENEITRELNPKAVSMNGKRVLERMRGDWFELTLINDKDTQLSHVFKWTTNDSNLY